MSRRRANKQKWAATATTTKRGEALVAVLKSDKPSRTKTLSHLSAPREDANGDAGAQGEANHAEAQRARRDHEPWEVVVLLVDLERVQVVHSRVGSIVAAVPCKDGEDEIIEEYGSVCSPRTKCKGKETGSCGVKYSICRQRRENKARKHTYTERRREEEQGARKSCSLHLLCSPFHPLGVFAGPKFPVHRGNGPR